MKRHYGTNNVLVVHYPEKGGLDSAVDPSTALRVMSLRMNPRMTGNEILRKKSDARLADQPGGNRFF